MTNKLAANAANPKLQACVECGLVSQFDDVEPGKEAKCPRCHHALQHSVAAPYQSIMAYGSATLFMLLMSLSFPFMSFSTHGLFQEVTLMETALSMYFANDTLLTIVILLCIIVLPAVYVSLQMFLYWQAYRVQHNQHINLPLVRIISNVLSHFKTWLMADVFLIGILVAMVKMVSLAHIGLEPSFWAFCLYTLLTIKFLTLVDNSWLWDKLSPRLSCDSVHSGDTHLDNNHLGCLLCGQVNPKNTKSCKRCHAKLHAYDPDKSLQWAWAFLIAAVVFYIPANAYPIMYTTSFGSTEASTIISGVILLWSLKSYFVASVIFFASIMIPLAKIFSLIYLYVMAQKRKTTGNEQQNLKLYRITEFIGRWSMIDVFVVALLTALIQLNTIMAVNPGPAALSFSMVVILTMLSAIVFDSRIIWQTKPNKSNSKTCEKCYD